MERKGFLEKRRERRLAERDYEKIVLGGDRERRIQLLGSEGLIRRIFGEEKNGVKNLRKISRKTDDPQVLNDIGVSISLLGNHKEAAKVYEEAVKGYLKRINENPRDFESHQEVAIALQSLASSLHAKKGLLKKEELDRINDLFHDSIRHYKIAYSGNKNLKKKLIALEGMSRVMEKRGDFLAKHGILNKAKIEWSRSRATRETLRKLKRSNHSESINNNEKNSYDNRN